MPKKKDKKPSEYHGLLLIDKPTGITSHDVVDRVRKIYKTRHVGHTGTLDPRATGLLVLLLGEATKISEFLMGLDKSYEGTLRLGVVSDTYDADGDVQPGPGGQLPKDLEAVQEAAGDLTGDLQQVPPPYSAKKVAGKKLYEYARKGTKPPEVKARPVRVDDFEILSYEGELAEFAIDCTSGTYVRSLVHDLGQALGCGAILTELNRTDVGPFRLEEGWLLDDLAKLKSTAERRRALVPIRQALADLPTVYLLKDAERWLRNGQSIPDNLVHREDEDARPRRGSRVVLCRLNGDAVAIARVDPAPASPPPKAMLNPVGPWYQPLKQFEIPVTDDAGDDEE